MGAPHGFTIFTDAPFEFVKKQLSRFPAKLFICRDSILNSEAKTKLCLWHMQKAKICKSDRSTIHSN